MGDALQNIDELTLRSNIASLFSQIKFMPDDSLKKIHQKRLSEMKQRLSELESTKDEQVFNSEYQYNTMKNKGIYPVNTSFSKTNYAINYRPDYIHHHNHYNNKPLPQSKDQDRNIDIHDSQFHNRSVTQLPPTTCNHLVNNSTNNTTSTGNVYTHCSNNHSTLRYNEPEITNFSPQYKVGCVECAKKDVYPGGNRLDMNPVIHSNYQPNEHTCINCNHNSSYSYPNNSSIDSSGWVGPSGEDVDVYTGNSECRDHSCNDHHLHLSDHIERDDGDGRNIPHKWVDPNRSIHTVNRVPHHSVQFVTSEVAERGVSDRYRDIRRHGIENMNFSRSKHMAGSLSGAGCLLADSNTSVSHYSSRISSRIPTPNTERTLIYDYDSTDLHNPQSIYSSEHTSQPRMFTSPSRTRSPSSMNRSNVSVSRPNVGTRKSLPQPREDFSFQQTHGDLYSCTNSDYGRYLPSSTSPPPPTQPTSRYHYHCPCCHRLNYTRDDNIDEVCQCGAILRVYGSTPQYMTLRAQKHEIEAQREAEIKEQGYLMKKEQSITTPKYARTIRKEKKTFRPKPGYETVIGSHIKSHHGNAHYKIYDRRW